MVIVVMKAYHVPLSALNLWGHPIWWKNNWFLCYYTEYFSSSSHSENKSSWGLFLPCSVQVQPDLVVIALDKCHSVKWSKVVSPLLVGGCLCFANYLPNRIFFLWLFSSIQPRILLCQAWGTFTFTLRSISLQSTKK